MTCGQTRGCFSYPPFVGTLLLYAGWANNFYDDSQLGIALPFSALFYLIFLIAPMLRAYSRRQPLFADDLWLFVQALVTVAIPIQLRFYSIVLSCAHMEVAGFWTVRQGEFAENVFLNYQYTSLLLLLWSAIPLLLLQSGRRGYLRLSVPAAFAGYVVGIVLLVNNVLTGGWIAPEIPFFNTQWLTRFLFVLSLWIGMNWTHSIHDGSEKWTDWTLLRHTFETVGHVVLVILFFVEVNSWISSSRIFSPFMRFGFVSVLWSLQALIVIGFGLVTRSQFRRRGCVRDERASAFYGRQLLDILHGYSAERTEVESG